MPTKALANDSELEFEFFLSQKLGMTVARMRSEMDNSEFVMWGMYYSRKAQRDELAARRR